MYDIPVPSVNIEYPLSVSELGYYKPQQRLQAAPLIIVIDKAHYEPEKELAHIEISKAFDKSGLIRNYDGSVIFLTYNHSNIKNKNCPHVYVPLDDIARDLNFMDDTVTIHISNIPVSIADKIRQNLCLSVNADVVKSVSALVFPPPDMNANPYDHLNP